MTVIQSILFFGLALAYLIALPFLPFAGDGLLKMLPVASLLWPILLTTTTQTKRWLVAAVVFSFVGDGLLTMSFVAGLGAFLVAQLCYSRLFWIYRDPALQRVVPAAILLAYLVSMALSLWPHLGELQLPVAAYMFAIGGMGVLAMNSGLAWWSAVIGALFFIASDSMIAIDKFLTPLPLRDYLILSSYFFAQWALVRGFIVQEQK